MFNFILQIVIMSSFGLIVYLAARAVPRVGDTEDFFGKFPYGRVDRLLAKIPLDKIDITFSVFLEKFLRKMKLFLLKWDNLLGAHIEKIKNKNGNNSEKQEEKQNIFGSENNI